MDPVTIPLKDNGKTTFQNFLKSVHPKSSAASSKEYSIFSNAV